MHSADMQLADAVVSADDWVGMLGAFAAAAGAAGLAAVGLTGGGNGDGGGSDGGTPAPAAFATDGTVDSGVKAVNREDHADGADISETGTLCAVIDVPFKRRLKQRRLMKTATGPLFLILWVFMGVKMTHLLMSRGATMALSTLTSLPMA